MNPVKMVAMLIGLFIFLFITRIVFLTTPLWEKIVASPWWIYALMAGIVVSGYLSYKYSQEEKEVEQRFIEAEGEKIMEPIREKRRKKEFVN